MLYKKIHLLCPPGIPADYYYYYYYYYYYCCCCIESLYAFCVVHSRSGHLNECEFMWPATHTRLNYYPDIYLPTSRLSPSHFVLQTYIHTEGRPTYCCGVTLLLTLKHRQQRGEFCLSPLKDKAAVVFQKSFPVSKKTHRIFILVKFTNKPATHIR